MKPLIKRLINHEVKTQVRAELDRQANLKRANDPQEFEKRLKKWIAGVEKLWEPINREMRAKGVTQGSDKYNTMKVSRGKKYVKIILKSLGQESVFAFINATTGDILKPAGWARPAKHARGNLFDQWNGLKYMTAYGPAYLR